VPNHKHAAAVVTALTMVFTTVSSSLFYFLRRWSLRFVRSETTIADSLS
jgi:hypothetical protein